MSKTVGFHHGVLVDKFEEQANKQGYTLGEEAERLQPLGDALLCWIDDIITDRQYFAARTKLHRLLIGALKPLKEDKTNEQKGH